MDKIQFNKFMQTFPVGDVYRALLIDRNAEAIERCDEYLKYQDVDTDLKPSIESIESLIYRLSDPYMSVDIDYHKKYSNPMSAKMTKKLLTLKFLSCINRAVGDEPITQELLDELDFHISIDTLKNEFSSSDEVKIKSDGDAVTIDLGRYSRIPAIGPNSIQLDINEYHTEIENIWNSLNKIKINKVHG